MSTQSAVWPDAVAPEAVAPGAASGTSLPFRSFAPDHRIVGASRGQLAHRLPAFDASAARDEESILVAAWATVLARYTGAETVEFGVARDGRPVLVRVSVHEAVTAAALIERLAKARDVAVDSGARPYSTVGRLGEQAFLHSVFSLHLEPHATEQSSGGLSLVAEYERTEIDDRTAELVLGHTATLFNALIAAGENLLKTRPLGVCSSVPDHERKQILDEWNETETFVDWARSIPALLREQCARTPGRTAVIFHDSAISFRELDFWSDQIAAVLGAHGAGPEQVVAVALERSLALLPVLFGIWKTGAAYLPLDPAFPRERIEWMLEDSGARILVADRAFAGHQAFAGEVVLIERTPPREPEATSRVPDTDPGPGDLAYMMYTSGSTGRPKGVMVEHAQVLNFLVAMDRVLGTGPGVWLAVTSISFDISVLELFWTLTRGLTVVIAAEEDKLPGGGDHSLAKQIRQHQVTHLQMTPSLARIVAAEAGGLAALAPLEKLILGGELLPAPLAERLHRTLRGGELWNLYGPTETTVWSLAHRVRGGEESIPIGRPIANTRLYILDDARNPVPVGVAGELWIGGWGVARGYWKRPELTAERFVTDPFLQANAARMYRTGDRARYRPDGTVEFLGRIDHQIKILGVRIEPEEVEAILATHPSVAAAVVVAHQGRTGEWKLGAFAIPAASGADAEHLRAFVAARVPGPMIPSRFVLVSDFPTTPNAKIDRRALAARLDEDEKLAASAGREHAPETAADFERAIAGAWKQALGLDSIDPDANFFDLGANSLAVAEVAMRLGELTGEELVLTDLFAYPTVRSLAHHLARSGPAPAASATQPVLAQADRGDRRKDALRAVRARR